MGQVLKKHSAEKFKAANEPLYIQLP